jgi:blocked-early-in-transport protein 1
MNSFSNSNLHQRDPRSSSSLFDSYSGDRSSRPTSRSPATNATSSTYAGAYPGAVSNGYPNGGGGGLYPGGQGQQHNYRAATPNSRFVLSTLLLVSQYRVDCVMWMNRGHYSDAVLSEL